MKKTVTHKNTGLARALSKMGYCSRSAAEALIRDERVALNGKLTRNTEAPVSLGRDRITVDGKPVRAVEKVYWILNKPRGLVTTADDEKGRETVYSLLPPGLPWMGPVGRLDKASEGLLLMTNDTEWAARITAPASHFEKTYHVQVDTAVPDALLEKLAAGVKDAGEVLRVRRARHLRAGDKNCWIEVVLDEGKNRQIRRMVEAAGVVVLRLVRVAIGGLSLGDLPKGAARPLTRAELKRLRETV